MGKPAQRKQRLWGLLNALQSAAQLARESPEPGFFKAVDKLRQQIVDEYGGPLIHDEKEPKDTAIIIIPGVTINDDGKTLAVKANINNSTHAKALAHYLLAWGGFDK